MNRRPSTSNPSDGGDEASEPDVVSPEKPGLFQAVPFPVDMEPRKFAFGEVRLCPRCGGKRTPTFEKLGYMPDPNGDRGDDKERIRCQRCNGWGFLPNKGL